MCCRFSDNGTLLAVGLIDGSIKVRFDVTYFFVYKTEFFSFQNNPKDLDPSYKMDLDLLDCLGRVKLVL